MRVMARGLKNSETSNRVTPSEEVFSRIGNLAFEQLAALRHRGAFTTVSNTFATCCQLEHRIETPQNAHSLLERWYKGVLDCILTQASTTRRSAGIPSIVSGILSAHHGIPLGRAMEDLTEIARRPAGLHAADGSRLPQVHASNCLNSIFKASSLQHLEKKLDGYIPICFQLAADNMRSEVWAIRNSGLILLRGLVDKLFGTSESKSSVEAGWDGKTNRINYSRYPTLAPVILNLLKTGSQTVWDTSNTAMAEAVFPALDMIRRAGPPPDMREEVQKDVADYLSSPVWHVREMAARTLCSCLLGTGWLPSLKRLVGEPMSRRPYDQNNRLHGALLTAKFLIERVSDTMPGDFFGAKLSGLVDFLMSVRDGLDDLTSMSPYISAAALEVINLTSSRCLQPTATATATATAPEDRIVSTVRPLIWPPSATVAVLGACLGRQRSLLNSQLATHLAIGFFIYTDTDDDYLALKRIKPVLGGENGLLCLLESLGELFQAVSSSDTTLPARLFNFYIDVAELEWAGVRTLALKLATDVLVCPSSPEEKEWLTVDPDVLRRRVFGRAIGLELNPGLGNEILRLGGSIIGIMGKRSGKENLDDEVRGFSSTVADFLGEHQVSFRSTRLLPLLLPWKIQAFLC